MKVNRGYPPCWDVVLQSCYFVANAKLHGSQRQLKVQCRLRTICHKMLNSEYIVSTVSHVSFLGQTKQVLISWGEECKQNHSMTRHSSHCIALIALQRCIDSAWIIISLTLPWSLLLVSSPFVFSPCCCPTAGGGYPLPEIQGIIGKHISLK